MILTSRAKSAEGCESAAVQKQLEWLTWRISWLEWSTSGKKRSFSRPLVPDPSPPFTAAATGFNQVLSEDIELWARESGKQRLRRRVPQPLNGTRSTGKLPALPQ